MERKSFYFDLPNKLIAQKRTTNLDKIKLFLLLRGQKRFLHLRFKSILDYLEEGDLLVLNNSAVIPTRLWAISERGGQVEVTLVSRLNGNSYEALIRPDPGLKASCRILFGNSRLVGLLLKKTPHGTWNIRFNRGFNELRDTLYESAELNTPFYLKGKIRLKEYQTVYAKIPGSTQCPTAGLHFDNDILNKLKNKGVIISYVTLHIGGSVLPVNIKDFTDFHLNKEYFEVSLKVARDVKRAKLSGKKVVAVGTTVIRALESSVDSKGSVCAKKGWTRLTIKPGYRFKVINAFLTNFHLPGSSHLLLTCAFGSSRLVLSAYKEAVEKRYKFLDFGDAMFIL